MHRPFDRRISALHWCIVFCMVAVYVTGYYRDRFTTQMEPANWYFLVVHMNVGALIVLLSALALFYRLKAGASQRHRLASPYRRLALAMHFALYFMLFAIPVTAYIGTGFDFPFLGIVNLPGFMRFDIVQTVVQDHLQTLMITFTEPFANFHRDLGTDVVLPVLLVGHIGAAIYHHFADR